MDINAILAIIFLIAMSLFLYHKRKHIQTQKILFPILYFVMYKTKWGLKLMDKIAKTCPRLIKIILSFGIYIGFAGIVFICYILVDNTYKILTDPGAATGVQPVLPFEAKGVFFVPFVYWIISIFVIATVHEFSHGIAARVYKIKLKSSGFAFLGILIPILPAAFVEPDEKTLNKASIKKQLSVFVAGPLSNILSAGLIFLLLISIANPLSNVMFENKGIELVEIIDDAPAFHAGLKVNDVITKVNGVNIIEMEDFTDFIDTVKPAEVITITTNSNTHELTLGKNPKDNERAYFGISSKPHSITRESFTSKYGTIVPTIFKKIYGLFFWLFVLSLGIGLFNLVPVGPIDGGRMMRTVLHKYSKKNGLYCWKIISYVFLLLILFNLFFGFVK